MQEEAMANHTDLAGKATIVGRKPQYLHSYEYSFVIALAKEVVN